MRIFTLIFCAFISLLPAVHADDEIPPLNFIEHARWARNTKDLTTRIKRLENFLKAFVPLEDGVKVETEFEDGSSALAVTGSTWILVRAYVENGQKEKALKVIDWLQENDSKSDVSPRKAKKVQGAVGKSE